jgi:hypothetical protein
VDGQLVLGIGLIVLALAIPVTALILVAIPKRSNGMQQRDAAVLVDQERVRGVQLISKGQEETMAGMKVHLGNIDGRLERIEKKIYE